MPWTVDLNRVQFLALQNAFDKEMFKKGFGFGTAIERNT